MQWTVAIGIDTHKHTHVAVALDRLGAQLDAFETPATSAGYLALYRWAHGLGEPAFALEGAGSYGAGLARFLQAAGCSVNECERPQRGERRQGKSDLIDALIAARRLLAGERLGTPRGLSGPREDLRLLLLERRGAIRARTATLNQLQALVVTAPARLRSRLSDRTSEQLARSVARLRPGEGEQAVVRSVLRRLGRRVLSLDAELAELDRELEAIVSALVPELIAECGVGPVCAAQLVVSSGDPARMATEASFAALAGTSPVDASSGKALRQANACPLLPPQALLDAGAGLDNIEASRALLWGSRRELVPCPLAAAPAASPRAWVRPPLRAAAPALTSGPSCLGQVGRLQTARPGRST